MIGEKDVKMSEKNFIFTRLVFHLENVRETTTVSHEQTWSLFGRATSKEH